MIEFSKDLHIPEQEYANQGNAILGIRDSGKSYTATWLAERLLDAGIPFVAFDPIGVWRNLKLPGKGKGYEVVVAGDDGDLALTPESAPEIVRAAMRENIPLVIDLYSMALSKADWKRIVEQCVRVLLFENKRHGLRHVFIEEAAEFAPQRVGPDVGRVYAEIEKLARMGGNAGLGYTLINQRAEEVNKAILELCDCLFLHRQKGRHSLTALGKWLDAADVSSSREISKSLPSLEQGECWVWSQGRKDPVRVRIAPKRSHHPDRRNLAATATAAKASVNVGGFVERLQTVMASGVKPATDKSAERAVGSSSLETEGDFIERIRHLERRNEFLRKESERLAAQAVRLDDERRHTRAQLSQISFILAGLNIETGDQFHADGTPRLLPVPDVLPEPDPRVQKIAVVLDDLRSTARSAAPGDATLPKSVRAILAVLKAHHPKARSRESVALQAGYSAKGGSFQNSLSMARTAGLIEGSSSLAITAAGRRAAGDVPPIPTGKALVAYWLAHERLGRVECQILKALTDGGRRIAFPRTRVAVDAGYEATGGSFQNGLSRLRTLGLITGSREITAAAEFFTAR